LLIEHIFAFALEAQLAFDAHSIGW
jgi:hypothetical protein